VRKPILQPAFDGLRKAGLLEETRKLAAKKPGRENVRKEERVRCSWLVDWPVYPRLTRTTRASKRARKQRRRGGRARKKSHWTNPLRGSWLT
jgi:hypothetical protein